ncbi:hypothetical protein [Halobacillus sp. A5]|uniref:hypothetical protein n=1 Tax=Halobacillus sp. A5 TaxID=2880263 RepID=UPI0020A68B6F|nr:hypothetical protein [Halobacillus sp. A5]MCP3027847.1 hypothetical protein [Halobacillus sp. A5]
MKTAEYTLADTGLQLSKQEIQQLTYEEEYWFLNEKFVQAIRNVEAYYLSQSKDTDDLYRPYKPSKSTLV